MTPSEVAAAIKARPNLGHFREYRSALQYELPNGSYADLPGGEFRKYSHTRQAVEDISHASDEGILVFFAPVPGKDLAVGISRYQMFPDGKQPDYDTVIKALIDKYGKPSGRDGGTLLEGLFWLYDANLKPISKPKSIAFNRTVCDGVPDASTYKNGRSPYGMDFFYGNREANWALDPDNNSFTKENIVKKCGETILSVSIYRRSLSSGKQSPLVNIIDTRLSGLVDVLAAQQEASRIVAMHQKNSLGKEAAKAKQRKLDL